MSDTVFVILDVASNTLSTYDNHRAAMYPELLADGTLEAQRNGAKVIHIHTEPPTTAVPSSPRKRICGVPSENGTSLFASPPPMPPRISSNSEIHPALPRFPHDLVITTKYRRSAFHGTTLERTIRELGTTSVVIAGVSTSGSILPTVLHAANLGLPVRVIRNPCMDPDEDLHRGLMDRVVSRSADRASAYNATRKLLSLAIQRFFDGVWWRAAGDYFVCAVVYAC